MINNNIYTVLRILYKTFKLNFNSEVVSRLKEHPYFPSFLSIQHVLMYEGVDSIAISTTIENLRNDLPKPVLVHVQTNTDLFLLVKNVDESNVHIINEKGGVSLEPINSFLKIWDGNAMLFDSEGIKPRKCKLQDRVLFLFDKFSVPFVISVLFLFICFFIIQLHDHRVVYNYLFLLFSLIGGIFSGLLVLQSFDEHNPYVKRFCTSRKSKKINCSSILTSKDAYFLGILSWSDIGIVFFSFVFLLNLFKPDSFSYTVTNLSTALSFPYVFYSITYQKFVAKTWCRLCLGVQAMIAALFVVSFGLYIIQGIELMCTTKDLIPTLLIILTICACYILLKQLLAKSYELKGIVSGYRSLKHDAEVKQIVFKRQQIVAKAPDTSIVLGNPVGKSNIKLVVSPVCNPCINELKVLIPILKRKENTRIELIFLTDKKEIDPLAFNLAVMLIDKYNSNPIEFINDLWIYIEKYPSSKHKYKDYKYCNNYEMIERALLEQINWSITNKLYSTPAIFIDGRLLPSIYSTKEIDFFCL